jgi:hypothetical protein
MVSSETHRLLLLLSFAYVYCLEIAPRIANKERWKRLNDIHESCFIDTAPLTGRNYTYANGRGDDYYIGSMTRRKRQMLDTCLVTFWSFSHIVLYFAIGLLCPGKAGFAFATGVAFEWYEYKVLGCHDLLDILFNGLGLIAGRAVGRAIF